MNTVEIHRIVIENFRRVVFLLFTYRIEIYATFLYA